MQCYTELTPPTAVTHSISLPFLSSSANNLIVAKTSLLQIFALKSIITDTGTTLPRNGGNNAVQKIERVHTTKLILLAQYELSGTVTSLARVRIQRSRSGGEALLVALGDAKLSLVEWDPERYAISTISIHYYEREDMQGSPWDPDLGHSVSYLCVDPGSRCAALKFGKRHLAILPFHQTLDDLAMLDYDPEIDGVRTEPTSGSSKIAGAKNTDGTIHQEKTPYAASFVLSLLAVDPNLSHPMHLAFLYEYREPTFGILFSQVAPSSALIHERRDVLSYAVYTLDLEQRASTTLLSVNSLPYDLFAVRPLPLPIGGALLVGGNELIHVDQSGKTNAVAVNIFAKTSTAFPMLDQSELAMRLENCVIEQLSADNREMLIVLDDGELAILSFKIDGRSVSGLSVRRVAQENGGDAVLAGASCTAIVGRGRIFVGSESADSIILGWSRKSSKLKRQRSRVNMDVHDDEGTSDIDEVELEDDDDDLYAGAKAEEKVQDQAPSIMSVDDSDDYTFRVHDSLQNCGPINDVTLQRFSLEQEQNKYHTGEVSPKHQLVVASGQGKAGGLLTFKRNLEPVLAEQYNIPNAYSVWVIRLSHPAENASDDYGNYIIASIATDNGEDLSAAFKMTSDGIEELKGTDFDPKAGATIDVGSLNGGSRIVQVLPGELRTYEGADFGLAQIYPVTDDDMDAGLNVVSASFADPYVLLLKEDSTIMVLKADEKGDLEEIESGKTFSRSKWLSGSLYEDSNDFLRLESGNEDDDESGNVLMFLLGTGGGLQIFHLPNFQKPVYVATGLGFLPPFLSTDFAVRRSSARETLTEILVADLGDAVHKAPYLILRSANDDLIIYQPYQSTRLGTRDTTLRFLKVQNPRLAKLAELSEEETETKPQRLRATQDIGSYSTVFLSGASPSFILKSASSPPQVINMNGGPIRSLCELHTSKCEKGFMYIDDKGAVNAAQLPSNSLYSTGWVSSKISMGEEVQAFDYHVKMDAYVLGTSQKVDFKLPEDEFHDNWNGEDVSFLPQIDQGTIKLLDHKTWTIIDQHELDPTEIVLCIKTMSLATSEHDPKKRQELVVVGTTLVRGEALASQGRIYVFDIIDVVPEPDRLVTGHKLKLIAKEEVKGAITALSEIGQEGFLLVAQGQKCMVRGLKEDRTLLPVAFMDMQCYVSCAKELKGTGLCVMGDPIKGVSFVGYSEEPYQLRQFGKSLQHVETIAANFLPDGKQLFVVVADSDCNLHILQFDPDNPRSANGTRLLHHTTFHTGHAPSTLTPLPPSSSNPQQHTLLLTSPTGSLSLLSPLPAPAHRTLSALQSHLQSTLPHPLGLNPRLYRAGRMEGEGGRVGVGGGGGRGVVDGMVVRRWGEGGSWRRWGEGSGGGGMEGEVRGLVVGVGRVGGLC